MKEIIAVEIPVPEEVRMLHGQFSSRGYELHLVGGCVRDFLKGVAPKDYDLATNLDPDSVQILLEGAIICGELPADSKIRGVGKSFGVILVTINSTDFEIATFRKDSATGDGRRPDSVVFSTLEDDAARRDLTVNALYYDIGKKCVIDFFGGVADLRANRVRFVGDAAARISEDKLRVMRFARFHCRVNPGGPESVHKDAREVIRNTTLKPEVSGERIYEEFSRGLASALDVRNFILILDDLGLLGQIFTGLKVTTEILSKRHLEFVTAQILRYNDPNEVKEALLEARWTIQEATNVAFLLRLASFTREDDFVDFKKLHQRTSLPDEVVLEYYDSELIAWMLEADYPTVKGDEVSERTGLSGKALGEEMKRLELENFKKWCESCA